VEAADLMRWQACRLFDARQPCGAQADTAEYLAVQASWEAANVLGLPRTFQGRPARISARCRH
jgi:hypothetical protein